MLSLGKRSTHGKVIIEDDNERKKKEGGKEREERIKGREKEEKGEVFQYQQASFFLELLSGRVFFHLISVVVHGECLQLTL